MKMLVTLQRRFEPTKITYFRANASRARQRTGMLVLFTQISTRRDLMMDFEKGRDYNNIKEGRKLPSSAATLLFVLVVLPLISCSLDPSFVVAAASQT